MIGTLCGFEEAIELQLLCVSVVFPPAWHHGGTPVTAHALAKAIIQQGHHVFAVCTGDIKDGSPVLDTETEWDGVPVVYCSRKISPIPFYSPALRRQIASRAADYDVVTIRSSWAHAGPAASRECRKWGTPYLAYPEGNFDPWALRRGKLKKLLYWKLFDRVFFQGAAAIVALTKSEAESIYDMDLMRRVEIIPNGVNVCDFVRGSKRIELEARFPGLKGRTLVLSMSRIHPIKGLPNLITAFKQVHFHHPDALLVIAGPDDKGHRKEVERFVQQEGMVNNVLFTGLVSGDVKIGLLKNSDVFVLPSYSEGFPVVVLEALSCGLPVVLTKSCHIPEVAEARAGIEVELLSGQIVNALDTLLADPLARRQMGENGYRLAAGHFSWERVARLTIDLCSDVLR